MFDKFYTRHIGVTNPTDLKAMLDGTIPTEMQEKYLCIVLRETERLTKLTSGLLTLNSMDPKQNRLCRTCFDINTVIKIRLQPSRVPVLPEISPLSCFLPTGNPMSMQIWARSSRSCTT